MSEKMKDLRVYFCAAIIVMMFLPWASLTENVEVLGYSDSAGTTFTGLQMVQMLVFGSLVYLIPLVLIIMELVPAITLSPKVFYLLGSAVGLVFTILSLIFSKSLMGSSVETDGASIKVKITPGLGFWLTVGLYLAIIIYTLVKDYALSKEAIREKGIKGAIGDIAGSVTSDLSEQAAKVQGGELGASIRSGVSQLSQSVANTQREKPKQLCPSCGAEVAAGRKFCAKCGCKLETQGAGHSAAAAMTVREYIAKQKTITCEKCGAKVAASTKFCPDCGERLVFKETPEYCECGAKLIPGTKFCPDCGKSIIKKTLQETCKKCGADLVYGKKFCVECGEKVED